MSNIKRYLTWCKRRSQIQGREQASSISNALLAIDPKQTPYIPIHFFNNYIYMIDKDFEEKGPYLNLNYIYSSISSMPLSVNNETKSFAFKTDSSLLVGSGIIFDGSELKFCIMISSEYVLKIYGMFFEFLLTKSKAYKELIVPSMNNEQLLNYLYTSLSYDFFNTNVTDKDITSNILVYRDNNFSDRSGYIRVYQNIMNDPTFVNEDQKLMKSMCFCKVEIDPFQDIDGPEKELISIL